MQSAPAEGWGVVSAYHDAFGSWTEVPVEVQRQLVLAMGGDPDAPGPPSEGRVHVTRRGAPLPTGGTAELRLEAGGRLEVVGIVPHDVPFGYHDLLVSGEGRPRRLIVSPGAAWLPEHLRTWGWATQLYGLRSRDSWGVGDLADLRRLGSWSRRVGAGILLVNPLDAVNPITPREPSPYYPSTRRWRDPLYLRIEEVPGAAAVPGLAQLRAATRADGRAIDRDRVYTAKLQALDAIWQRRRADEPAFDQFRRRHSPSLERFGTFSALAESFRAGWRDWPADYHHPDSPAVASFAEEHRDRVRFHMWMQWLLDEQLRRAGEAIPLLGDLPIGSDPDGADAWEWQDLLAEGVSVGAPPDELGPEGQDWQIPAFVPWKLRDAGYEPFVEVLRSSLRHCGGLRIDHVLGLFRLFWIPPGAGPASGAYVRQPVGDLLDIVALESHRAEAVVVGEDLGTVEDHVRPTLHDRRILRYQVWWFEDEPVERWTRDALASVSTHDLPTVAGVWSDHDLDMQRRLGRDPDVSWFQRQRHRLRERAGVDRDASVEAATVAVHRHLGGAPNRIVVAQIEDAIAEPERPNVPGTDRSQRANWSLALPLTLEELEQDPTARAVAEAMSEQR